MILNKVFEFHPKPVWPDWIIFETSRWHTYYPTKEAQKQRLFGLFWTMSLLRKKLLLLLFWQLLEKQIGQLSIRVSGHSASSGSPLVSFKNVNFWRRRIIDFDRDSKIHFWFNYEHHVKRTHRFNILDYRKMWSKFTFLKRGILPNNTIF